MLEIRIQTSACEYFHRQRQKMLGLVANFHPDRFCGEDEEHDPSEEFEEYLACAVCGDNGKLAYKFLLIACYAQ